MSQITLRRTKNVANIKMVGKEHHLRRVDFVEGDHKNIHDVLYYTAQVTFGAVVRETDYDEPEGTPLTAMFEMVLRVRQACCSGELIPKERYIRAAEIAADLQTRDGKISAAEGFRLLNALQGIAVEVDDDDDEDSLPTIMRSSMKPMTRKKKTSSRRSNRSWLVVRSARRQGTTLCTRGARVTTKRTSIVTLIPTMKLPLPTTAWIARFHLVLSTKTTATMSSAVTSNRLPRRSQQRRESKPLTCNITQTAPKIDALLATIDEMKPEEKGVIFSQFTTFLNRVEKELWAKGHSFTRIDGSMNAASRIEAIKEFSKEDVADSPRFILCSLRAAGTGINLTRGNVAFMLDPWWNQAVSAQVRPEYPRSV